MKVQCMDVQSAQSLAQHAAQYRFQDHGIIISADGDTLSIMPASPAMRALSSVLSKFFDLFHTRRNRDVDQLSTANSSAA